MKLNIRLLILILGLCLLIFTFSRISLVQKIPVDYYELQPNFFLQKIDYFSNYQILVMENHKYRVIIRDVTGLFDCDSGTLIRSSTISGYNISFLSKKSTEILIIDQANKMNYCPENFTWINPWQIVEKQSVNDRLKIYLQIVLFAIIIVVALIIKEFFGLKRLSLRNNQFDRWIKPGFWD